MYGVRGGWLKTFSVFFSTPKATCISDVNKDWICKDKDKDQAYKDQDKDKDFTYSCLLQVAAKPTNRYQATTMNTKWKYTTCDCKTHYTKTSKSQSVQ